MALPFGGYSTASPTAPTADLTDFSLIIDLANFSHNWWSLSDTLDPTKGRVSDNQGNEFAADWMQFDPANHTGQVRVMWPGTLAATGGQTIRVYAPLAVMPSYAPTDPFGAYAVYDTQWVDYRPIGDASPDRTTGRTASIVGGTVGSMGGKLGLSASFTPTLAGCVNVPYETAFSLAGSFSLSMWVYPITTTIGATITTRSPTTGSPTNWHSYIYNNTHKCGTGTLNWTYKGVVQGSNYLATNTWQHLMYIRDTTTSQVFLFYNGVQEGVNGDASVGYDVSSSTVPVRIGGDINVANFWNGGLQELQIHSGIRPLAWYTTEYAQTNNNYLFWNYGWTYIAPITGLRGGMGGILGSRLF